jgi:putative zinc finger/helix-turn-helix YgiT family protein
MKCTRCGAQTKTRFETRRYDAGLDETIELPGTRVDHCDACGEEYVGIKGIEGLHEKLAMVVAKKKAQLTPKEIRFLRLWLGYSSADFANEIGVARETVSRWESGGQKMGLTAERLLRHLVITGKPCADFALHDLACEARRRMPIHQATYSATEGGWQLDAVPAHARAKTLAGRGARPKKAARPPRIAK